MIQQPTVKSGTVAKTQHFFSHSFSPRPPVVQQPAKTLASDFFFIWFPFGARSRDRSLKLTSNQPCRSLHRTVAASHVSWCSDSNANTTNYTTVTHTHTQSCYVNHVGFQRSNSGIWCGRMIRTPALEVQVLILYISV